MLHLLIYHADVLTRLCSYHIINIPFIDSHTKFCYLKLILNFNNNINNGTIASCKQLNENMLLSLWTQSNFRLKIMLLDKFFESVGMLLDNYCNPR